MVYKVPGEAENNKSDIRQDITEDLALPEMLKNILSEDVATSQQEEADKILKTAQKRYKLHHDRHVRFTPMFSKGDEVCVDRPLLFRSANEKSTTEGYIELFLKQQGLYKVIVVKDNALQMLHDELEKTDCIYRATLAPSSRRYCDRPTKREDKG